MSTSNISRPQGTHILRTSTLTAIALALLLAVSASTAIGATISLTAVQSAANSVSLSWTGDGFASAPYYQVSCMYRGSTVWRSAGYATSYTMSGLASTATYAFQVKSGAVYSNIVTVEMSSTTPPPIQTPPSAPANLTARTVSTSQIYLTWTDTSSNETGFRIEKSSSAAGPFAPVATLGASSVSYTDGGLSAGSVWYYRVYAYNAVGSSAYSNTAYAQIAASTPAAPGSLVATAVSQYQIDLSWTSNSSNETGFKIERSSASTGPFYQIATVGAGVTSYSNTGLAANIVYYYRVCAYNQAGNSGYTNVAGARTQAATPASPSNLTATAASLSQIDLTWDDNASNETGFRIERTASPTGSFAPIAYAAAGTTSYSSTGLQSGVTYYYRVCAYNYAGCSTYSNVASATTGLPAPTAPSNLSATAVSIDQIDLQWQDNSADETGFQIERSGAISGPFSPVGTAAARATGFSDTGLAAGTTYYYRVRAYGPSGDSAYTNTTSATTFTGPPAAPGDLSASAISESRIDVTWTDNAPNETGFRVERSLSATGTFSPVASLGAGVTSYSDSGLREATTYYYRVYAHNTGGASGYTNIASATTDGGLTAPATPANLTVQAATDSELELAWQDTSSDEDGFRIERSLSLGAPFVQIAVVGADAASYRDSGLLEGTTYLYRVRAYNAYGDSDYTSAAWAKTKLKAPTALSAIAASATKVDLSWVDNSQKEAYYIVERSQNSDWGQDTETLAQLPANTTAYSDSGCQPESTYYYRVKAIGSTSDYSNTAVVRTTSAVRVPNPKLQGFISDFGSVCDAVVFGNRAYLASDIFGVVVADLTDPTVPVVLGSQHPHGSANQIALGETGSIAVATGTPRGTDIVDLSNPYHPTVVSSVDGSSVDAAVSGDFAYVASAGDLKVVDIATPSSPRVVNTLITPSIAYGVAVSGSTAVVSDAFAGLHVVNITNPYAPSIEGSVTLGGLAGKVIIAGSLALVSNSSLASLQIVDISLPTAPRLVSSVSTGSISNITVKGNLAYVSAGMYGLVIVDISAPASPRVIGAFQPANNSFTANASAVLTNGMGFIAGGVSGLWTVDVSMPSTPVWKGTAASSCTANQVAVAGSVAIATGTPRGTDILNVADPLNPCIVGSVPGSSVDAAVDGSLAYVVSAGDVKVVDISTPSSPRVVNTLVTPNIAYGIAVSGGSAVVSDAFAGLHVLNIDNPSAPRIVGSLALGGLAGKVTIAGDLALVSNSNLASLQIVDISTPTAPTLVSALYTGSISNITASGNLAYVSAGMYGLLIVDISTPRTPVVVGRFKPANNYFGANSCCVVDRTAFIAGGATGLWAVDVSLPSEPRAMGTYPTVGNCSDVAVSGETAVTADNASMINVFDLYQ